MTLPEGQGSQDVPAASYSNHKNRRGVSQVMCKRRHIVFEMLDGVQISVEFRDHCCRTGIDIQIELADLSPRMIPGAQSPSKRLASQFWHVDARKCVPFLIVSFGRISRGFVPVNVDDV